MFDVTKVPIGGPLSGLVPGLAGYLARAGYRDGTVGFLARLFARLSGWLDAQGLAVADLDWLAVDRFVVWSKASGRRQPGSRNGVAPLVGFLLAAGVVAADGLSAPAPVSGSPQDVAERFIDYMFRSRGMAVSTARSYRPLALAFLGSQARSGLVVWDGITVESLQAFLTGWSASRCAHSVELMASVMRAVLRFAFVSSLTGEDWSGRVGKVASKSLAGLAEGLTQADMDRLVGSVDVTSPLGARDKAVLVMLARLGLRAGEVARLRLDDIDWRGGTILLRDPKNRHDVRVPMPADVGAALVGYLRVRDARDGCRSVFLRGPAPAGPLTYGGVSGIVAARARAAGLGVVHARRLRHGAAMAVIADGGTLTEAGQLLGHAHLATTLIYAKTDAASLRPLAVEWPGTEAGGE